MIFGTHPVRASALLITAALALPVVAQAPANPVGDMATRSRWLQAVEEDAVRSRVQDKKAAKAAAERRQREFTARLADFATSWNKLMQLADQGGWNAKEARKTRQAFERLVRTEGWIEEKAAKDRTEQQSALPATPAPQPN